MPVFLTLGFVGLGLLLLSLVFDHDHDYEHGDVSVGHDAGDGHDGPSWFNLKVVASFLAAFGFGGAIASYYGIGWMPSSLVGVGSGFVLGFVVYQSLGFFYRQQASSHVTAADVLGGKGFVTVRIAPNQTGEVMVSVKGGQYSYLARTADGTEVKEGWPVEVVELLGETAVVRSVARK